MATLRTMQWMKVQWKWCWQIVWFVGAAAGRHVSVVWLSFNNAEEYRRIKQQFVYRPHGGASVLTTSRDIAFHRTGRLTEWLVGGWMQCIAACVWPPTRNTVYGQTNRSSSSTSPARDRVPRPSGHPGRPLPAHPWGVLSRRWRTEAVGDFRGMPANQTSS